MIETWEQERARIFALMDERKEFVTDVDGYVYYWPNGNDGHLAAHHLRAIADELDRRNAAWDTEVQAAFARQRNAEADHE